MRAPLQLWRDLGWSGFLTFQLVSGGTVVTALAHNLFVAGLAIDAVAGRPILPWQAGADASEWVFFATCVLAYGVSIVLAAVGLARRKLLRGAWMLAAMPLYWVLLSVAAWAALFDLVNAPHRWAKTDHGLAVNSRRAQSAAQGAAQSGKTEKRKKTDLAWMEQPGPPLLTDTAATRRRPPRACA